MLFVSCDTLLISLLDTGILILFSDPFSQLGNLKLLLESNCFSLKSDSATKDLLELTGFFFSRFLREP